MRIIAGVLVICILGYGTLLLSKSRTFQFFGGITSSVEINEKKVALTFDDAPSPFSNQVVDTLAKKGVKATFYVIGKNLETYPAQTRPIIQARHELGNHSYSHQRMVFKSLGFIDDEIQRTNKLLQENGYLGPVTFRPPNGKKLFLLPWYLSKHGIKTIMWDVEPDTYVGRDSQAITAYVLEHTKPGSIILLHPFCEEACAADREALPQIIDALQDEGYQFVTVSELISR